jgi:biotin carboxyl carrier protein
MKYYVQLDPTQAEEVMVDVQELPSGELDVRLGGRKVEVDVAVLGDRLSLRIDGKVFDLAIEGTPPDLGAINKGHRSYFRVSSDRMRAAEAARGSGKKSTEKVLKSPMPGRVVKVMVEAGQVVEAGTPLMVVEAMKMENELKAKGAGTVETVKVKVGDTVEVNAVLLTFGA